MSNVCAHVITVYLIAVKTKMCLEMLHMKKQGPSMDVQPAQEKWENLDLHVCWFDCRHLGINEP